MHIDQIYVYLSLNRPPFPLFEPWICILPNRQEKGYSNVTTEHSQPDQNRCEHVTNPGSFPEESKSAPWVPMGKPPSPQSLWTLLILRLEMNEETIEVLAGSIGCIYLYHLLSYARL